ncbi:MAG: hypothetical protein M1828_003000 [Chrysothrix sp. TS-e1954]|nr:MAG: hypothetical protein M1828_003000 [Chrysothrix sp. TS-e1954]
MENSTPTNDEVIQAVNVIRADRPFIGRAKLLSQLKQEHNWNLSPARFKKLTASVNELHASMSPIPPNIPQDALAAQLRYKRDSTRHFRIYGRGEYNFGVSLNADQAVHLDIAHTRLMKAGRPQSEEQSRQAAVAWPTRLVWDNYFAAAKIAGVSKAEVGAQIESEYGVPLRYLPVPTIEEIGPEAEKRKAAFKAESLKVKRQMLRESPESRKFIPTDGKGEPLWSENVNGQFALLVVKIDKGEGLKEFGNV